MPRLIPRLSAAERTAFIAAARSLVGKDFAHRGRGPEKFDCLGVVDFSLRALGYDTQDERLYGRRPEPDAGKLRGAMAAHFGDPVASLAPGCVVTMQWHGVPNHVAVVGDYYLGGLSLIHALALEGRVVETRLASPWDRRIHEVWRP
jgi:hypothetical protein